MTLQEWTDAIRFVNAILGVALVLTALLGPKRHIGYDLARVAFALWGWTAAYGSFAAMGEAGILRPINTFIALVHSIAGILIVRKYRRNNAQSQQVLEGNPVGDSTDDAHRQRGRRSSRRAWV